MSKFDKSRFEKLMTKATQATLNRMKSIEQRFNMPKIAFRGFANKYAKNPELMEKKLGELDSLVLKALKSEVLVTGESFQATQKGPTRPVTSKNYISALNNLKSGSVVLNPPGLEVHASKVIAILSEKIGKDTMDFDGVEAWSTIPKSTVRGFPFHAKGSSVDDEIVRFGRTYDEVFQNAQLISQNGAFPGFRIQGKKRPDQPKIRFVFIPPAAYQYFMVPLVKSVMERLKVFPTFCGGLEPGKRNEILSSQLDRVSREGKTFIQLDFSKFDVTCGPAFRVKLIDLMKQSFDWQADRFGTFSDGLGHLNGNQFLFYGESGKYNVMEINSQLFSGLIDTQLTGSLVNLIIQHKIWVELIKEPFNIDNHYCLGDDVLMAVPNAYVEDATKYKAFLEDVEKIVSEGGFVINAKKAYPAPEGAFLQKLVVKDYVGRGTILRAARSLVYPEKYFKPVKGVNSAILALVSQISIASTVGIYLQPNLGEEFQIFADGGLEQDDLLKYFIGIARSNNWSENQLFEYIIRTGKVTFQDVLEYLDKQSFDSSFLKSAENSDYSLTFPILTNLLRSKVDVQVDLTLIEKILKESPAVLGDDSEILEV